MLRHLTELDDELRTLGMVNDAVHEEFAHAKAGLAALLNLSQTIDQEYTNVMDMSSAEPCDKPFQRYMTALHALEMRHVPDWHALHEGVEMLVDQCRETPEINDDLYFLLLDLFGTVC